jgi:flagellar biosynthesis component FlhA
MRLSSIAAFTLAALVASSSAGTLVARSSCKTDNGTEIAKDYTKANHALINRLL